MLNVPAEYTRLMNKLDKIILYADKKIYKPDNDTALEKYLREIYYIAGEMHAYKIKDPSALIAVYGRGSLIHKLFLTLFIKNSKQPSDQIFNLYQKSINYMRKLDIDITNNIANISTHKINISVFARMQQEYEVMKKYIHSNPEKSQDLWISIANSMSTTPIEYTILMDQLENIIPPYDRENFKRTPDLALKEFIIDAYTISIRMYNFQSKLKDALKDAHGRGSLIHKFFLISFLGTYEHLDSQNNNLYQTIKNYMNILDKNMYSKVRINIFSELEREYASFLTDMRTYELTHPEESNYCRYQIKMLTTIPVQSLEWPESHVERLEIERRVSEIIESSPSNCR